MSVNKTHLKKGLIALGIPALLVAGIVLYALGQRSFLTWEQYQEIIKVYNVKIQEIKGDCTNDKRCKNGSVIFAGIQNKEEIKNRLDEWIAKDEEDPNFYKK